MGNIAVNFQKEMGKIKPLNGVNSGPKTKVFTYDASEYFKEANIALVFTSKLKNGYAIASKINTKESFKQGINANIELTKPTKLKIPINGTTTIFANKL